MNGLFKFGRKDTAGSQTMMRGRIAAQVGWRGRMVLLILFVLQGFTIFALLGGVAAQVKQKTWVKPGVRKEEEDGK